MTDHYSRIFLLSHMRAYSSTLGHIIGSHPRINGYYEMHQSYLSDADLAQQIADYSQHDNLKPDSHYQFDKLLHNGLSTEFKPARIVRCCHFYCVTPT